MGKTTIQVHISESLSDSVSFDLCSMQYITVLVTPMKATGLMVSGMVMVACTGVTEESNTPATGSTENR